jgi:hypothetical protein
MWDWFVSIIDAIGELLTGFANELDEPVLTGLVLAYLHAARRLNT